MLKQILVVWILLAVGVTGYSQQTKISREDELSLIKYEDSLGMLAYMIVNDSLEYNRFAAVRAFIPKFVKALKYKNSFQYPFKQLQTYISILYPPDSTFRIITWQVHGDGDFQNYGAIQMNEEELKLFPLLDRSETYQDVEDRVLTPKEWFGAIYYRLMPLKTRKKTRYLLFGFDNYNPMIKRKLLDVLSFEDGKPVFGAPVFEYEDGSVKYRMLMTYYAGASTTLNYDVERKKIIYDHLIKHTDKSGQNLQVSDGSYEGFEIKKGKLIHIDKVFHLKVDEPPRPYPVLNGESGPDILGRPKGKKH